MKKIYLILLSFLTLLYTRAQEKPGGTNLNVELWLKANTVNTVLPEEDEDVVLWKDMSGNGHDFEAGNQYVPIFIKNSMNYNPAVSIYFDDQLSSTNNHRRKLQSINDFPIDLGKSYYVFWVSEANIEASSNYGTVFSLNAYAPTTSTLFGWRGGTGSNAGKLYHRTGGNRYSSSYDLDKSYGIAFVALPNVKSLPQDLYFNGKKDGSTTSGQIMNDRLSKAVIGTLNDGSGYTDYFEGEIQEIIVLSTAAGNLINQLELHKVQSYLALKYGVTLDKNDQPDYINSNGSVFWKGSQNIGYQNSIFGIGRDDASGLYQKQSTSKDNRIMTAYLNDLKPTNIENTGVLPDNTFMTFGANEVEGSRNFDVPKGTAYQNGVTLIDLNEINNTTLKAQIFGSQNLTVNIKPHIQSHYILVSNTVNFTPAQTRVYLSNDEGFVKNVLINDGDYLAFAFYEIAPGGVVNGIRLWLRADDMTSLKLTPGNNNNVDIWKDQTSNNNDYTYNHVNYSNKLRPTYNACDPRMNFNPSLQFNEHDFLAIKDGPMSKNSPDGFTSFVVYHATNYEQSARLYTHGFGGVKPRVSDTRSPAMGFAPGKGYGRIKNYGKGQTDLNGSVAGFVNGTTALQMINTQRAKGVRGTGYGIYDFGGWQEKVIASGLFGDDFKMAKGSTLGGGSYHDASFEGLISEVFFYERTLSEDEQNRIRSYLGMKYAITLDSDASNPDLNYDYVLSDGSTQVWRGNSSTNKGYHNNVGGVVRDDNADVNINKSRSTAEGAIVSMATPGTELCSTASFDLKQNLSGVFWGNNHVSTNATVNYAGNTEICGEIDQRLARIWLAEKTNLDTQPLTIRAGGSSFLYDGPGWKVSLLIAKNAEDFANNNWALSIPGTYKNGEHEFNYTFTDEYTYFTFGAVQEEAICETCKFSGVKRIEFLNKKTWNKGDRLRNFDFGDGFSAKVEIIDPDGVLRTKYPRGAARKSLKSLRHGRKTTNTNPVTTKVTFSKAAAASFEIYEIDQYARKLNNVEVYGMCGGVKIKPTLTYIDKEVRSTYTIDTNTHNDAKAKKKSSGYLHKKGRMHVEFDKAVEEIYIVNRVDYTSSTSGYKRIGLGPMELHCPPTPPSPTVEGLIFTKQASTEVLLCEEVNYTFRIENISCDNQTVNFKDVLPAGLKWVVESLVINDEIAENAQINDYSATNTLSIDNLLIASSSTVTLRAQAIFDLDATAKTYENRAELTYIANSVPKTILSCDRLSAYCESSKTIAVASERPEPITSSILMNTSCYNAEEILTVTLTFNNPNSETFEEMFLDASFDDNFTYVPNSLSSSSINLGGSVEITVDEGQMEIEGFKLPTGTHSITFKVQAPLESELLIDPETLLPIPFSMVYDLNSETEDICQGTATLSATGEIELPYCTYCTESPNPNPATEFAHVGISTFKNQIDGWPSNVPNGFVVMESSKRGFVMTRTTTAEIKNPTMGMIIYDTENKCISLYNGTTWSCIKRSCNK